MQTYDETDALRAQLLWRYSQQQQYFDILFLEVLAISAVVTKSILKKRALQLPAERVEEVSLDATLTLLERMTRAYRVRTTFHSVLFHIVFYNLFNTKKQFQDKEQPLPEDYYLIAVAPVKESEEDTRYIVADLLQESWGRRAMLDRARATSYEKFILKIATYVPRRQIYNYAKRLLLFYQYTPRRRRYRRQNDR